MQIKASFHPIEVVTMRDIAETSFLLLQYCIDTKYHQVSSSVTKCHQVSLTKPIIFPGSSPLLSPGHHQQPIANPPHIPALSLSPTSLFCQITKHLQQKDRGCPFRPAVSPALPSPRVAATRTRVAATTSGCPAQFPGSAALAGASLTVAACA